MLIQNRKKCVLFIMFTHEVVQNVPLTNPDRLTNGTLGNMYGLRDCVLKLIIINTRKEIKWLILASSNDF